MKNGLKEQILSLLRRRENFDPLVGHSRYATVEVLDSGASGLVIKAIDLLETDKDNKLVAIKLLERGPKLDVNVKREIVHHRNLNHPHVIRFREAFLLPQYLAIVLDYAPCGNMYTYVKNRQYEDGERESGRLREDEARWYFQQLVIAVDYCHRAGVACRDIKLENALLSEGPQGPTRRWLKICDFGLSKSVLDSLANSQVGTVSYMAPEVILCCGKHTTYDPYMADVWSCGCFLYCMVVGSLPFSCTADSQYAQQVQQLMMMRRTVAGEYIRRPPLTSSSEGLQGLLARLLVVDPCRRATLGEVMTHPWFRQGLPRGALEINARSRADDVLRQQSMADVERVLRAAREPLPHDFSPLELGGQSSTSG